ncbi:MAG: type II toxin-antitoxin system ParD family antitoxin [Verrucomicrobiota bacterium]
MTTTVRAEHLEHLPAKVDIPAVRRENAVMQVALTRDRENFIAHKVRTGGYANASEVVREALRRFRAKDDPAEVDSEELAEMLLPAVRGRHRPLTAEHFNRLRLRARHKPARA